MEAQGRLRRAARLIAERRAKLERLRERGGAGTAAGAGGEAGTGRGAARTGAAALMLQANPGLTPPLVKAILQDKAADEKVIFIKADEDVTYGDVVYAVDIARASAIEVVGLIPRPAAAVVPGV